MRASVLVAAAAAVVGLAFSGAEPRSACADACDKDAAACVDACETKHGNDAPARVGCKVKCAEQRAACEKPCARN